MKRFLTILSAPLLPLVNGILYGQKTIAENDYNLWKVYMALNENNKLIIKH